LRAIRPAPDDALRASKVLVDAPTYFAVLSGEGSSGATDIVPAIKWQISWAVLTPGAAREQGRLSFGGAPVLEGDSEA
jgi:hypothetical protein